MTLRVLIADDEAPARRKLERFLEAHADVELVGQASNGVDAIDLIGMTKPDVVFLDIHMPDLDGIGVAEALLSGEDRPTIVFVTAHDHYAIKAFDVRAVDYLLKPYDRERFERALERAVHSVADKGAPSHEQLAAVLADVRKEERYARRLLITENGRSSFVALRDVVRVESDGNNNVAVHTKRGRFVIRATLDALVGRLDPEAFVRVHRSHLVNIDEIAHVESWFHGDYKLRLRDGTELTWSRRYAAKRADLLRPLS